MSKEKSKQRRVGRWLHGAGNVFLDAWDRFLGLRSDGEPVPFSAVLARELQVIRAKRDGTAIPPRDPAMGQGGKLDEATSEALDENLTGLAFSGGGIRSATFNLGIVQTLADLKLLRHFDYLSTVSGGGYIGSWLTALIDRENRKPRPEKEEALKNQTEDPEQEGSDAQAAGKNGNREELHGVLKVEHRLRTRRRKEAEPEDEAVTWLRQYSNYLTPRVGMLTADTWTTVAVYLRNLLLNLLVLVCGLAVLPLIPRIVRGLNEWLTPVSHDYPYLYPGLSILISMVANCGIGYSFASLSLSTFSDKQGSARGDAEGEKEDRRKIWRLQQSYVQWFLVLPIVISSFLATQWLPRLIDKPVWVWMACTAMAYILSCHLSATIANSTRWGGGGAHWWWASLIVGSAVAAGVIWRGNLALIGWTVLALTAVWLGVSFTAEVRRRDQWDRVQARWFLTVTLSALAGAVGGLVLMQIAGLLERWAKSGPENDWTSWTVYVWGTPLVMLWFVLLGVFHTGLLGRSLLDRQREWLNRLGAWLWIYALGWAAVFALVVYGPVVVRALQGWTTLLTSGWVLSTLIGLLAGRGGGAGGPSKIRRLVMTLAPYVFVIGLLVLVVVGMNWGLGKFGTNFYPEDGGPPINRWKALNAELWRIHEDEAGRRHEEAQREAAEEYVPPSSSTWLPRLYEAHEKFLTDTTDGRLPLVLALAAALLGAGGLLAWRIDVNEFSMHRFYRNRLVRAYLGASVAPERRQRQRQPFTGFYKHDDLLLAGLESRDGLDEKPGLLLTEKGPLHLINTALNLVAGEDLAWQERKAASFVLSPLFCGFDVWDKEPSSDPRARILPHGYRPTREPADGHPAYGSDPMPLTLGSALAISGAAASPNMGKLTSPAFAFLLTVFNVRLGWWLGNPRHRWTWKKSGPFTSMLQLFRELTGKTRGRTRYVYLSDGGHFENLGIYELVRRRCRFIVACDAGADPELRFDDLGNAIRKCRADFGIDIEIDVDPIRRDAESGFSKWHCAVGTIHYSQHPDDVERGMLLYVKASLTGDEPEDILNYARSCETFPHQTTADQFFDESQFESYRRLGHHVASHVLKKAVERAHLRANESDGALRRARFEPETMWLALEQQWLPTTGNESFTRHTAKLDTLFERQRSSDALAFLDGQVYPEWPRLLHGDDVPDGLPADTLWLPEKAGERREGFYFCNSLIQLMEDVYVDLDLEEEYQHPDNRGWMNLFKHWTWSGMFRATWAISASTYGPRFQSFCRERLGLDLGQVETVARLDLKGLGGEAAARAFEEGLASEDKGPSFLNFVERDQIRLFLRYSGVRVKWVVQPELVVHGAVESAGSLLRFGFGYVLIDDRDRVVLYRVQDHLRLMGLGRRGLRRVAEDALASDGASTAELTRVLHRVACARSEDPEEARANLALRRHFEREFKHGVKRFRTLLDSVRRELEDESGRDEDVPGC